MFALDFDIRFISSADIVDSAFVEEVEAMTGESGGFSVVEDGLIRDREIKNGFQDRGGFPCSDGKGDVKG